MTAIDLHQIQAAEIVLPCSELDQTLPFFTEVLGFQIHTIFPADDPSTVVLVGHGLRIRLQRGADGDPGRLRLLCRVPAALTHDDLELTAPNGTRIDLVPSEKPLELPPLQQSFVLTRLSSVSNWNAGRAGMRYRDLIPDRQGGRIIASHIQIPSAGPVPDYVHFHKIFFQMIYCYKGWVRVVYEDQGPPLKLEPGDCVLQPPQIRHRVLESSAGLEVIEIGCPARHETCADHELSLPTKALRPEREFEGQRFVHHQARAASWQPWRLEGFEARDVGMEVATGGLVGVLVARSCGARQTQVMSHDAEFVFLFVLCGSATLLREDHGPQQLSAADCLVIPAELKHALISCSDDLELLEVCMPSYFATVLHADTRLPERSEA